MSGSGNGGAHKATRIATPWFGMLPEGWDLLQLRRKYNVTLGKMLSPTASSPRDVKLKYICAKDVHFDGVDLSDLKEMWYSPDEIRQYQVQDGDLLIVEGGAGAGNTAIVDGIGNQVVGVQNSILIVRPKENDSTPYLCYCLTDLVKRGYMTFVCSVATIPHFTKDKVLSTPIPLPPQPIQRRIVAFLDEKTAAIERLAEVWKKEIGELEELKKAIIHRAVTRGIENDPHTNRTGNADSVWFGILPDGWEARRLKTLLAEPLQYGANSSGIAYDPALPRYIRITDISMDGRLKDDNRQSLDVQSAEAYILNDGDVLFARSGATVGKAFIYHTTSGIAAYAGYLIRARVNSRKLLPEYLFAVTQSKYYELWKDRIFIQSTIQNISAERYNNLIIPLPPLPVQREIVTYLDDKCAAIDGAIASKRKSIEELGALQSRIIADAVTGAVEA